MIPGNQDEILRRECFQRCCHRFHVSYSLSKSLFFLKLITDPNDAELAFSQRVEGVVGVVVGNVSLSYSD